MYQQEVAVEEVSSYNPAQPGFIIQPSVRKLSRLFTLLLNLHDNQMENNKVFEMNNCRTGKDHLALQNF